MAIKRRQKTLYKRLASVVVPVLSFVVVGALGVTGYLAHTMVRPEKRVLRNTPLGYEQLLQKPIWDNKTWTGAGGNAMAGWLMYHEQPAPFIICSHGFNENREEVLNTSFLLWDAGYNVLAYDLRAHGENKTETSSLGPAELDDLKATIAFAKSLKTDSGAPMCDGKVGLYGIDLGGYVSLSAAATDDSVRAVAVDTVYPSREDFIKTRSKAILGNTSPPDSAFIESSPLQALVRLFLGTMTDGGTEPLDAPAAIAAMGSRPVLLVASTADPRMAPLAAQVAASAPNAQKSTLPKTRSGESLYDKDAEAYDRAIVAFFTSVPDLAPPAPSDAKKKAGEATPPASAATAPTSGAPTAP